MIFLDFGSQIVYLIILLYHSINYKEVLSSQHIKKAKTKINIKLSHMR